MFPPSDEDDGGNNSVALLRLLRLLRLVIVLRKASATKKKPPKTAGLQFTSPVERVLDVFKEVKETKVGNGISTCARSLHSRGAEHDVVQIVTVIFTEKTYAGRYY